MHVHGDILDRQDADTLQRCLVSSCLDKKAMFGVCSKQDTDFKTHFLSFFFFFFDYV